MRGRLTSLALLGIIPLMMPAGELHVGPGQPHTSLRAAIAAAQPGDTLFVHHGRYAEGNILLDKSLTLHGLDRPVLDGGLQTEVLTITASGATVRGFDIQRGGSSNIEDHAGIRVAGATHVTLEDNRISDCSFGIFLSKSRHLTVRGNTILGAPERDSANGNGIHAWSCDHLDIADNHITDVRDGIYLEFVTDSAILRNRVADSQRYGLHFMFAHRNRYRENTFVANGAGVAVMYSREVEMTGNHFTRNWGASAYGLLLKDISDSTITGNTFESNSVAITIQNSSRLTLARNRLLNNGWALQVDTNCTANTYRTNNFIGNAFDLTAPGSLEQNIFEGNYWDKAETYDLDRDGAGDLAHRPLSLFAMLVDRVPTALLLLRSPLVHFLDRAERIFPTLTPDGLSDPHPAMRPHPL